MSFVYDHGFFFFQVQSLNSWVGYFRSFLQSDVCTILTICLVIRQSGEGCPCQEGGQGTNSFLFLDTSIYQAWLHASHTLKVGLSARVCVFCVFVCMAGQRLKDQERWVELCVWEWDCERYLTGRPDGCGVYQWCKIYFFLTVNIKKKTLHIIYLWYYLI